MKKVLILLIMFAAMILLSACVHPEVGIFGSDELDIQNAFGSPNNGQYTYNDGIGQAVVSVFYDNGYVSHIQINTAPQNSDLKEENCDKMKPIDAVETSHTETFQQSIQMTIVVIQYTSDQVQSLHNGNGLVREIKTWYNKPHQILVGCVWSIYQS